MRRSPAGLTAKLGYPDNDQVFFIRIKRRLLYFNLPKNAVTDKKKGTGTQQQNTDTDMPENYFLHFFHDPLHVFPSFLYISAFS